MRSFIISLLLVVALCGFAAAQDTGGSLGKHDVSDGGTYLGCKGCHVPHAALSEYRIWGRALPTTALALNAESEDYTQNAAMTASNAAFHTAACLSCHDGITATSIISGATKANLGDGTEGLKNDHPTHARNGNNPWNYLPTAHTDATGAVDYGTLKAYTGAGVQAFGSARWYPAIATPAAKSDWYVECTSCHEPHNGTGYKFVRGTTPTTPNVTEAANLGLCRNCHNR